MTVNNNPLKQYFRRPAVYIRLPSAGKYYSSNTIDMPPNGEVPVFPMTAIDEITTKTPDALYNGSAMVELMKSCIPNIKDPWSINSIDVDAIFIGIRVAATSNNMEIKSNCPKCENEGIYNLDLVNLLSQISSGDYETPLQLNDLTIKFKPITYKNMNDASITQVEIQRLFYSLEKEEDDEVRTKKSQDALKRVTELTIQILTEAIEYIEIPGTRVDSKEFIEDYLKNCDKNVYTSIRDHNIGLRSASEIKPLKIKCVNCSHEYEQPFTLNTSDFFG